MEKLKGNFSYIFCAVLGALNFVFFAIPYISANVGNMSEGISGYTIMSDMWETDFAGVMSALIAVLILVASIEMLAIGVMGLVKAFAKADKIPNLVKLADVGLFAYAILNALLLLFLVIFTISNSEEILGIEIGYSLSAGIFVSLALAVVSVTISEILKKKLA